MQRQVLSENESEDVQTVKYLSVFSKRFCSIILNLTFLLLSIYTLILCSHVQSHAAAANVHSIVKLLENTSAD
jgi:hypothetical protein